MAKLDIMVNYYPETRRYRVSYFYVNSVGKTSKCSDPKAVLRIVGSYLKEHLENECQMICDNGVKKALKKETVKELERIIKEHNGNFYSNTAGQNASSSP